MNDPKREVGRRAAELVEDGMIVGLGTGSTAKHFVDRLGERVRDGLRVKAVATSERTARQAESLSIELATLDEFPQLDLAVDGADEVDPRGDLIKGLGGALYREKLVARASREFVVIVDSSKEVANLGEKCPVPVEIVGQDWRAVADRLRGLGARPTLRGEPADPYVTDNGNLILDAAFGSIPDPRKLERRINSIPGVLENGIFAGMTTRILIAGPEGIREWTPPAPTRARSTGG